MVIQSGVAKAMAEYGWAVVMGNKIVHAPSIYCGIIKLHNKS